MKSFIKYILIICPALLAFNIICSSQNRISNSDYLSFAKKSDMSESLAKQKTKHFEEKGDRLYMKNKFKKAFIAYQKALTFTPNNVSIQRKVKSIKYSLNQNYQKALYETNIGMADEFYYRKDYKRARIAYQRASKLISNNKYSMDMIQRIDYLMKESK